MARKPAVPSVPPMQQPGLFALLQALKQAVEYGDSQLETTTGRLSADLASSVEQLTTSITGVNGAALLKASNLADVPDKAAARTALSLVPGTHVQEFNAATMKSNTTANMTVGYTATSFNAGSRARNTIFTPDTTKGNLQYTSNTGAHTLKVPTADCSMVILYTNATGAGVITPNGFTKVTNASRLTLTVGHKFLAFIVRINGLSLLSWEPLQ